MATIVTKANRTPDSTLQILGTMPNKGSSLQVSVRVSKISAMRELTSLNKVKVNAYPASSAITVLSMAWTTPMIVHKAASVKVKVELITNCARQVPSATYSDSRRQTSANLVSVEPGAIHLVKPNPKASALLAISVGLAQLRLHQRL